MHPHHLILVASRATAASSEPEQLRRSLDVLDRLRRGWRPSQTILAGAQHVERWVVEREKNAMVYQFVGFVSQAPTRTSTVIGSVVALDPDAGWALLFGNRWITLGAPSPELAPFDPANIVQCAESWLLRQ
jgi:hypothetical protein